MASPTTPTTPPLPTIEQRPDANVVIFDGQCQFCTAQIARLHRLDIRGQLAFVSLHDPEVSRRYPDLTYKQMMDQMWVVDIQGRRHGGAEAFRYLTRHLPLLWPIAPLIHIPFSLPLWRWLYRQAAVRRYRWGKMDECEDGACGIHLENRPNASNSRD